MAYETGVASSPTDLVSKLATFAGSNGWTVNTPTSGRVFVNGDIYVGVNGDDTNGYVQCRGALGYDAGQAWNAQTNNAGRSNFARLSPGPFTAYHFFAGTEDGSPYLHTVVEVTAGRYGHFTFGRLVKSGPYTGGTYVEAVFWNNAAQYIDQPDANEHQVIADANCTASSGNCENHFWVDVDGLSNNWIQTDYASSNSTPSTLGTGSCRSLGILKEQWSRGSIASNRRTPFLPLYMFVNRPSSARSLVGRIPNMRFVNIAELADGEVVTIGADNWQVFPFIKRGVQTDDWSSSNYGYAYKR